MRAAALLLLAGCWTNPVTVVEGKTLLYTKIVPIACVVADPPRQPTLLCPDDSTFDECEQIQTAAWSDYGKAADIYIRLHVTPLCRVDDLPRHIGKSADVSTSAAAP